MIEIPGKEKFPMDGFLNELLLGLKNVVLTKNNSAVILIDGKSGKGKSTFATQIGSLLDNSFNVDKMFFDVMSFFRALSKAKKGDCLVFDEAMVISNRSSLSELNRAVVVGLSMIRSKNLFIIFCANSIFDIDRNIVLSRADLLLHVYGQNLGDRGNFLAFFKPKGNQEDKIKQLYFFGKKFYSYSNPRANFYGEFDKPFLADEIIYEKKKDEAVNRFLEGSSFKIKKRDVMLLNLILYLKNTKRHSVVEISKICNCSKVTIFNILKLGDEREQAKELEMAGIRV